MPQIITPLPSSLVTATTLQPQVVAKPVAARKFSIEEEIRDAVVVSHQNPYLNIQIGKVNETLQGAHNPKSGIQSDILKAMDRCVMASQQEMQQISAQSTAPPCVNMVQSQPTIKHGSSGSLICDYKDSVADTVREKSLVDSKKVLPSSEELSSVDKDMHTHTRNGENNVNQSNDPRQRFCQTHSAIITEVTVNSGTDSDSAQSLSISTVDHSRKTPLQNSTCNNISSNTEMSIKDNERGTDKYNPAKEICEPQPAIDNTLEKICSGNTVDGKKMGTLKPNVAEKICESDYDIVSTLETSCPGNASYDSATKTSNLNVAKQICEPCLPVDTTLAKSHQEKDGHCNEKESMQCNLSETISEPTPILGTALEKTCPEEVINNSETDTSNIDVAEEIFEPKPNRGSELGKNCSEKDIHRDDTPKLDLIEPIPSIDSSLEKRCSERSIHGSGTELSQLNCQQQMQEPKSSCDSRFEKNSVEEQPITVSQEAKDRNNVDTVVSGSSTLQPSTIPNTINILWKSKKNDAVAGTGPVVPKTGTEDDALISDSNISSASPSSIIITRLRKSKSIDSWSDDMFNDNTSLEEEQQSFKLQNGSVKELKVVLHDIKGVDSKIKPKYGICKTISDELLGKKDELFTDSVRSSDSSSIDSSSMPDVSSPHADIKRKSSPSRKKRLRNFAKADKSVCGNDFELITRSKRHFSSKSSEKPVSHDRFGAKSKKGTVEMCHRTNDDSASKRGRSRSYDSTWKIKQQNQENERRYPRRNPFTCLRSFSGLSPNYAIQSYSLKNTDIHDHSNLPTVKMSSSEESSDALTRPSRKNTKSARKKSNNKECNSKRKISTSQCCCVTKTEDTKNPSSTKVLQETQIASVHDDRTSSQNLDFCKRIFSAEESHSQIDNNSPSHCNITTNSAIVTSSSECDSTVSKVNPQM